MANILSIFSSHNRKWQVTSWYIAVKADGQTYQILGDGITVNGQKSAKQISVVSTPSRTSFIFDCSTVIVNATFLSPIFVRSRILIGLKTFEEAHYQGFRRMIQLANLCPYLTCTSPWCLQMERCTQSRCIPT